MLSIIAVTINITVFGTNMNTTLARCHVNLQCINMIKFLYKY